MLFTEYSKKFKPKINDAIAFIYEKKLQTLEHGFLRNYYSELKDYFLAGGKRIRPLLCVGTYNGFKKDDDEKIIIPSTGTEFLHNASLVHDDIIDKDELRRGEPSFHFRFRNFHKKYQLKKMKAVDFGNSIGIIGGDTAFFLGMEPYLYNDFENNLNLQAIRIYQEAFIEVANGVLIEIDMVNKTDLTLNDYIKMISLKTAALIEKSIMVGATYAKVNQENQRLLSIYGKNLGIIFQIIDDILGTFGDESKTGKPTDGDIREGKKTCLLIEALDKLSDLQKSKLLELIEKPEMNNSQVEEVKSLFKEANVEKTCKDLANDYYNEAKTSLNQLKSSINEEEFEFFDSLLNFVLKREF
jgi:geranylgeranyl pyrophosphate synthase